MNIYTITAPEHRYFPPKSLKVFLAGGICKCELWQQTVIKLLLNDETISLSPDFNDLYILNPRRVDWIDEPGAAERQIEWEFDMIERCDMFTMYFAGGESDQPICMYELGRNIEKMKTKFPDSWWERIVITCDSSYKRLNDVIVQTRLATDGLVKVNVENTPYDSMQLHYKKIKEQLKFIYAK